MTGELLASNELPEAELVEQESAEALEAFRNFVKRFEGGLYQWEVSDVYKRYCDLKPEFQELFWSTNISARNLDTRGVAVYMLSYLFGNDGSQTRGSEGLDEAVLSEASLIRELIENKIYRGRIDEISVGDILRLNYQLTPAEVGDELRREYNQLPNQVKTIVREAVRNSTLANVLIGLDIESSNTR